MDKMRELIDRLRNPRSLRDAGRAAGEAADALERVLAFLEDAEAKYPDDSYWFAPQLRRALSGEQDGGAE